MMGKLPLGVVSPYVKMSSGGCSDPLKFYATSYCTAYGEGTCVQEPPTLPRTRGRMGAALGPVTHSEPPRHTELTGPPNPPGPGPHPCWWASRTLQPFP